MLQHQRVVEYITTVEYYAAIKRSRHISFELIWSNFQCEKGKMASILCIFQVRNKVRNVPVYLCKMKHKDKSEMTLLTDGWWFEIVWKELGRRIGQNGCGRSDTSQNIHFFLQASLLNHVIFCMLKHKYIKPVGKEGNTMGCKQTQVNLTIFLQFK